MNKHCLYRGNSDREEAWIIEYRIHLESVFVGTLSICEWNSLRYQNEWRSLVNVIEDLNHTEYFMRTTPSGGHTLKSWHLRELNMGYIQLNIASSLLSLSLWILFSKLIKGSEVVKGISNLDWRERSIPIYVSIEYLKINSILELSLPLKPLLVMVIIDMNLIIMVLAYVYFFISRCDFEDRWGSHLTKFILIYRKYFYSASWEVFQVWKKHFVFRNNFSG